MATLARWLVSAWGFGGALGLAAGVGALELTKPMGLDDRPITKSTRTKVLTVAWYLAGGLVTALVIDKLRDRELKKHV